MDPLQQMAMGAWTQGMGFGAMLTLGLFFAFQVKHLVVDFFIQNRFPYMWMNKHKLSHPGGWLHAGGHAVASLGILALVHPPSLPWVTGALTLCAIELFIHFWIDLIKMRINTWKEWKCNTSPKFWDLLGFDQFLHQLTYLWMVYVWVF